MTVVLSEVRVDGFRSLRSAALRNLEGYSPLVGLNSSGKSNFLRALNLFFNGYPETFANALELERDFTGYLVGARKKKKVISVGVVVNLEAVVLAEGVRNTLEKHGIMGDLALQKSWSWDGQARVFDEDLKFGPDLDKLTQPDDAIKHVLVRIQRSIDYVFVPNLVRPADLIDAHLRSMRGDLIGRLRKSNGYEQSAVDRLMEGLATSARRMFTGIAKSVADGVAGTTITPNVPTDFGELVFEVALLGGSEAGGQHALNLEGSGAQAYTLHQVLELRDRALRGRGYGNFKASIWAIEEPESFLHQSLKSKVVRDLVSFADDQRRQVLVTTHDPEFQEAAQHCWQIEKLDAGTRSVRTPRELAMLELARRGVTHQRHPLARFADSPVVIAEGKFDFLYLRAAQVEAGLRPVWQLVHPDALFGEGSGGAALLKFLEAYKALVDARPLRAPLVVVRDWDEREESKFVRALKGHESSRVILAPENIANPELGPLFRGIERFLSTEYVEKFAPEGTLQHASTVANYPLSPTRPKIDYLKKTLVSNIDKTVELGIFMQGLIRFIDKTVVEALETVNLDDFLIYEVQD